MLCIILKKYSRFFFKRQPTFTNKTNYLTINMFVWLDKLNYLVSRCYYDYMCMVDASKAFGIVYLVVLFRQSSPLILRVCELIRK